MDLTCPDCGRPVETDLLRDPLGKSEPVPIWDCSWCQRTGFLVAGQQESVIVGPWSVEDVVAVKGPWAS